jgi:hypothetical protein
MVEAGERTSAMRLLKPATHPSSADPPGAGIAAAFPLNAAEICRPERTPSPRTIQPSQNRILTARARAAETRL